MSQLMLKKLREVWWFVIEAVDNEFQQTGLPVQRFRDLPVKQKYIIAIIFHVSTLVLLAGLTYDSTKGFLDAKYISLDNASGNCQTVAASINGAFYGTRTGQWPGSNGFVFTQAPYVFTFTGYTAESLVEYSQMMEQFQYSMLTKWSIPSSSRNLAENLLVWMATSMYNSAGNVMLRMTGNPLTVFDGDTIMGSVASSSQYCSAATVTTFNSNDAMLTMQYSISEYAKYCNSTLKSDHFTMPDDSTEFSIYLDTQSLLAALVAGYGSQVNNLDSRAGDLEVVTNSSAPETTYIVQELYDTRYPGMQAIYCASRKSNPQQMGCYLKIGFSNLYAIPVFNQLGYEPGTSSYCNCSSPQAYGVNCNAFNFAVGAVIFETFDSMANIMFSMSISELNIAAYNATLIAASGGTNPALKDAQFMKESFKFCDNNCTVVAWEVINHSGHTVSEFYYQVPYGSCRDTFSTQYWNNFVEVPPVPLQESYYECTPYVRNALVDGFGVAVGTASQIMPFLALFLLPLVYLYLTQLGFTVPKAEYSQDDKDATLQELAYQMLRIRDGKTAGSGSGCQSGVLGELTRDLLAASLAEAADTAGSEDDPTGRESMSANLTRKSFNFTAARNNSHNPMNTQRNPIAMSVEMK